MQWLASLSAFELTLVAIGVAIVGNLVLSALAVALLLLLVHLDDAKRKDPPRD